MSAVTSRRTVQAVVVVLGDLGRSPRMQLHALALARGGAQVRLVGYAGAPVFPAVAACPGISLGIIGNISDQGRARGGGRSKGTGFLLRAAARTVARATRLLWTLLFCGARPDVILVQVPPSLPTLVVALMAARLRGARLVVDWHNFGDAVLGLKIGNRRLLTRWVGWQERLLGRRADAHLCVSHAMAAVLKTKARLKPPIVLRDLPPEIAQTLSLTERRARLADLTPQLGVPKTVSAETPRPVLVTGTSWTLDEDFSVLLDAATRYDAAAASHATPPLIIVVTGRGPLRAEFEQAAIRLDLNHVRIVTAWLSEPDYRALLSAADLGLSFHRSASGVDLAMKVADMQGAGLPVAALDYGPCLREQIDVDNGGLIFRDGAELAELLRDMFQEFPAQAVRLEALRAACARCPSVTWEENWRRAAEQTLLGD